MTRQEAKALLRQKYPDRSITIEVRDHWCRSLKQNEIGFYIRILPGFGRDVTSAIGGTIAEAVQRLLVQDIAIEATPATEAEADAAFVA